MTEEILQIVIGVSGAIAFWMTTRPQPWSRWGYVVGLIGQPAWLYVTWTSGQPGMFFVSVLWTWLWLQGVWEQWILPAIRGAAKGTR